MFYGAVFDDTHMCLGTLLILFYSPQVTDFCAKGSLADKFFPPIAKKGKENATIQKVARAIIAWS